MKKNYQAALRQVREQSPTAVHGFALDLFPTSWSYKKEALFEGKNQVLARPKQESAQGITEKTKILDSFHEFAQKRLSEEKKTFSFPGGEALKKANNLFEDQKVAELSLEQLKELSACFEAKLKFLKFDCLPQKLESKDGVKALFVAPETAPLESLEDKNNGLEAFFEAQAAQLFERMVGAMKLKAGDFFVSSLNVLKNNNSLSFKENLVQEIFNLRPQIVIPLGGKTTSAFLGEGHKLQSSHGQFFERSVGDSSGQQGGERVGFEVMPLFSPAFLVEAPNTKRIAWEDMQKVMKKLGL